MRKLKLKVVEYYSFYCPGCKHEHVIPVCSDTGWQFHGSMGNPTFTPSLLNTMRVKNDVTGQYEEKERCHLFVTNGQIQFLSDCYHEFAGQTVELPEI